MYSDPRPWWRNKWWAVAVLLPLYLVTFVFDDELLDSPRAALVFGAVALYIALGLWLRFRAHPAAPEAQEPPAPPPA